MEAETGQERHFCQAQSRDSWTYMFRTARVQLEMALCVIGLRVFLAFFSSRKQNDGRRPKCLGGECLPVCPVDVRKGPSARALRKPTAEAKRVQGVQAGTGRYVSSWSPALGNGTSGWHLCRQRPRLPVLTPHAWNRAALGDIKARAQTLSAHPQF